MLLTAKPFRVCGEMNRATSAPASTRSRASHARDVDAASDASDASNEGKTVSHFDGKDLILQFTKMNVSPLQSQQQHRPKVPTATTSATLATTRKVIKHWRFKAKQQQQTRERPNKVVLRPSKLKLDRKDPESLFRDFSAACCKELETIASSKAGDSSKKKKSKKDATKSDVGDATLRRKASSCAEQARQQMSSDELSDAIDILADFLEESVVFPKKMSYMAELMYT